MKLIFYFPEVLLFSKWFSALWLNPETIFEMHTKIFSDEAFYIYKTHTGLAKKFIWVFP